MTVRDATHGPIRRHKGSGLAPSADRSARVWRRLLAPIDVDTLFNCRPTVAAEADTVNQLEGRRSIPAALRTWHEVARLLDLDGCSGFLELGLGRVGLDPRHALLDSLRRAID